MREWAWAIALVSVLASQAAAQTPRVLDLGGFTMPYEDDPMWHYYPAAARKANVEGTAKIQCKVTEIARLTECKVLSEEPDGYGFGEATIQLLSRVTLKPETVKKLNGGLFSAPVHWTLK